MDSNDFLNRKREYENEINQLKKNKKELKNKINEYVKIMEDDSNQINQLKKEINELKDENLKEELAKLNNNENNSIILRNNILNQLNIKIKGSLKTNLIISSTYNQIKNMEKLKCIEYLYSKLEMPSKFHINYSIKGDIKNINYE